MQKYISTLEKKGAELQLRLSKSAQDISSAVENVPLEQLKKFAKEKYEADEEDHFAVSNYLIQKGIQSDSIRRLKQQEVVKPGFVELKLLERIKSEISEVVYGLLIIPYFLDIKVIDVRNVIPPDIGVLKGAPITVVRGITLDVVKGKQLFSAGDTVQFYFYDFWLKKKIEFETGNKYFVLLDIRNWRDDEVFNVNNDPPSLALVMYVGDPNGYYPIVKGEMHDSTNFFKLGAKVPYNLFKKELRRQIQTIKSW